MRHMPRRIIRSGPACRRPHPWLNQLFSQGSGEAAYFSFPMKPKTFRRKLPLALLVLPAALALITGPALAACLSPAEARAVVASGQAASLAPIVRSLKQQAGVEVINGQLCTAGRGYVYRLTVLGQGGKVRQVTVDARSGRIR